MLETFKVRLKAKSTASGVNLSQKRIDALAERLHKKFPDLTEEKDHDEQIDGLYDTDDLKEIGALDDYQRAKDKRAADKKAKEDADKKKKEGEADDLDDVPDDTPKWAKALIQSNKKLTEDLANIQKEKSQGSIKSKATEKLKDVPAKFWEKRSLPEKEEELEAFVTDVTKDYDDFKVDMTNQGLSVYDKPKGGSGGGDAVKNKVPDALKNWGEKQKAENAKVLAEKKVTT